MVTRRAIFRWLQRAGTAGRTWLDDSSESEIIRPRATVWPMESRNTKGARLGCMRSDPAPSSAASLWSFLAEEGDGTQADRKTPHDSSLHAKKGAIFVDVQIELDEDGLGFEAQLDRAMRRSYRLRDGLLLHRRHWRRPAAWDLELIRAKFTSPKKTGQKADTSICENASKMFARMYPAGRQRAVWIAN